MANNTSKNKIDTTAQKIVNCIVCHKDIVVGKYAKNNQKCNKCRQEPIKNKKNNNSKENNDTFGAKLRKICNELDFTITDKRSWKKRYPIEDGGVATIHIMPEQGIIGMEPHLEYFSLVIQRAIGINEDFRKFLPPDAASDCELIAGELGNKTSQEPQLGQQRCDKCKAYTDQFGVDPKTNKILCLKPNNCFKKYFTIGGAESVQ